MLVVLEYKVSLLVLDTVLSSLDDALIWLGVLLTTSLRWILSLVLGELCLAKLRYYV